MKLAVVILASLLVFSASACQIGEFIAGLAQGLGYTNLTTDFEACRAKGQAYYGAVYNLTKAAHTHNPDELASAIENVGYTLAQAVRNCGKIGANFEALLQNVVGQINEVTKAQLEQKVLDAIPEIYETLKTVVAEIKKKDTVEAGKNVAKLLVDTIRGNQTATRRQLFAFPDIFDLFALYNDALEVFSGFVQTANTTLNAADVLECLADAIGGLTLLRGEKATQNKGLTQAAPTKCQIARKEFAAGLARDLPLFTNPARVENGVNALFVDFAQVHEYADAAKTAADNKDFTSVGAALGKIYNIFYGGLIQ